MVWTTPKTWASGYVVLASDLNLHLRDNLLVTAPAVMTTVGDIIYASGANEPARLAKSTTATQYLANTGTSYVPAWNEVALATGVSGTLPVANGGTGITSLTNKAVLISQDSGTSLVASEAIDANGELLIGGTSGPAAATLTAGSNITITNADQAITIAASTTDLTSRGSASTSVCANTDVEVGFGVFSDDEHYFIYDIRYAGSNNARAFGATVTITETVAAGFHNQLIRRAVTIESAIALKNGSGGALTMDWEVREFSYT